MAPKRVSEAPGGPELRKATIQDDLIMGARTNNSSIVSKRSVERLYFPTEPPFFRYFVKKPQRRSPLINRGYWLRMKAIDHVVRLFLEESSEKRKVVINLGCGYDPLPWQCLSRYPSSCKNTTFVDVDYRELMVRKRDMVQRTSELYSVLSDVEYPEGDFLLRSSEYLQIGCDLRDLKRLESALKNALDVNDCLVLLVAEVSITYMDFKYADEVIKWAETLPSARFCLIEQLLPDGIDHPFAATMMAHFEKLNTPLRAVQKYPTVDAQRRRYETLGWSKVYIRNLWELWASDDFISSQERRSLDDVEPFDEWEEFALFGCHYLLLVADNTGMVSSGHQIPSSLINEQITSLELPSQKLEVKALFSSNPKNSGCSRFGSPLPLRGPSRAQTVFGNFAGMGLKTRMDSVDVYSKSLGDQQGHDAVTSESPTQPSSRMCHTTTEVRDGALLVGGRTSPDTGMVDCWFYHKWIGVWERVDDLPHPLYRHQAISLGGGRVFISTGRLNSRDISKKYLVWSRSLGWVKCHHLSGSGNGPANNYGSIFSISSPDDTQKRCGILAGGMTENSVISAGIWHWELENFTTDHPTLSFRPLPIASLSPLAPLALARFGANVVNHHGLTYVVGGVAKDTLLREPDEIFAFAPQACMTTLPISQVSLQYQSPVPRPLLVGISIVSCGSSLLVMGGSAVCFSFGTSWNKGAYTLETTWPFNDLEIATWNYVSTIAPQFQSRAKPSEVTSQIPSKITRIRRVRINSPGDFESILQAGVPVIIEALNIGTCTREWTTPVLKEKVGSDREVIVHESTASHMDFKTKNFAYASKPFGDFMDAIEKGEKLYLRSLSSENAKELPACLESDYPLLAADFQLPECLEFVRNNAHSSPLRISGPVNMWLHYDVMANVLCQVRGEKKLLLFPPADVRYLGFEPGASSVSTDIFEALQTNKLLGCHPHEALLKKGDILFLPSLWPHTASPTSGISISVNVFFRDLKVGYAAGRDIYGNRDLQPFERGRQDIERILKSFDGLPSSTRDFYLQRLVAEFQDRASSS